MQATEYQLGRLKRDNAVGVMVEPLSDGTYLGIVVDSGGKRLYPVPSTPSHETEQEAREAATAWIGANVHEGVGTVHLD